METEKSFGIYNRSVNLRSNFNFLMAVQQVGLHPSHIDYLKRKMLNLVERSLEADTLVDELPMPPGYQNDTVHYLSQGVQSTLQANRDLLDSTRATDGEAAYNKLNSAIQNLKTAATQFQSAKDTLQSSHDYVKSPGALKTYKEAMDTIENLIRGTEEASGAEYLAKKLCAAMYKNPEQDCNYCSF